MAKTIATKDGRELANVWIEDSGVQIHNGYIYVDGGALTCVRCGGQVEESTFTEYGTDLEEAADDSFLTYCASCLDDDAAEERVKARFAKDPDLTELEDEIDTLRRWHSWQEIDAASNDLIWQWYEES